MQTTKTPESARAPATAIEPRPKRAVHARREKSPGPFAELLGATRLGAEKPAAPQRVSSAELGGPRERPVDGGRPARAPESRREPRDRERDDLSCWERPPPVLFAPLSPPSVEPAAAGTAAAHAEAAALADKLVTEMRIGKIGRDGHEVRMRVALRGDAGVTVRLVSDGGRISAELVPDAGMHGEARRIADALRDELVARGVPLDGVGLG